MQNYFANLKTSCLVNEGINHSMLKNIQYFPLYSCQNNIYTDHNHNNKASIAWNHLSWTNSVIDLKKTTRYNGSKIVDDKTLVDGCRWGSHQDMSEKHSLWTVFFLRCRAPYIHSPLACTVHTSLCAQVLALHPLFR